MARALVSRRSKPTLLSFCTFAAVLTVASLLSTVTVAETKTALSKHVIERFGSPPTVPEGPLGEDLHRAVASVFNEATLTTGMGRDQFLDLETIAESKDPRLAWLVSDLMRFAGQDDLGEALNSTAGNLLNIDLSGYRAWGDVTDHLIAWNIPEPPNYLNFKREVFTSLVPGWDRIFTEGDIDWRHVSWGGVLIDDRAYDTTDELCNCIPAADNPEVTDVAGGNWLDDDDIVFGVEVNGEYRAYPRQIMEVREMVNDTLGGRDLDSF